MNSNKYSPTAFDRFLSSKVNPKTWTLLMLMGIPLLIIATSILFSSVQSSLAFTPMANGSKASGVVMAIDDVKQDYPDFKPDARFAGLNYKEAIVQYSYNSQFYNLKLDAPIPDVGRKIGDTIPLLVNHSTPSKAVADIYPVPYNMALIVTMCVLSTVGLSLIIISLILRKRPTFRAFTKR